MKFAISTSQDEIRDSSVAEKEAGGRGYSHSVVPGGLSVRSYITRDIPRTPLKWELSLATVILDLQAVLILVVILF